MAENVIPPSPGVTPEALAAAVSARATAEAKLVDVKSRLEALEGEKTAAADEAAAAAKKAADEANATKIAELEASAKKAQETALAAFRAQHVAGLKDPAYLALVPEVTIAEDGTGLTEESVEALKEWKGQHAELFQADVDAAGGTTPSPSGRPSGGLSAEMTRNLAMAGVDPTKAAEAAKASPIGALIGWGAAE